MKIGLFNANGLRGKDQLISTFFETNNISLLFITETWLSNDQTSAIEKNKFLKVCKTRTIIKGGRRSHGGILGIADQKTLNMINTLYIDPDCNYAIVECYNVYIAVGYFPPDKSYDDKFFRFIEKSIDFMKDRDGIIIGDFNARIGPV